MTHAAQVLEAFEKFTSAEVLYQTVDGELFTELPDAQAYAAQLISTAIVTIPRPTAVTPEAMPFSGKWVFLPHGSASVLQDNLIINGFGELGGKVNFSKFQPYVGDESNLSAVFPNAIAQQSFSTDTKAYVTTDGLIAINPSKMYLLDLLASTDAVDSEFGVGLQFYDQDGDLIELSYISYEQSSTVLTAPLNAGDTYINISGVPSFVSGGGSDGQRNLAFLNYTFKNGKKSTTYGKNRIVNAYPATGHLNTASGVKLFLNTPYQGVSIPSGTKVVNPRSVAPYTLMFGFSHFDANQTTRLRRAMGGQPFASIAGNNINISRFAQYAKLVVKQSSEAYFNLILSEMSLTEIHAGADITAMGSFSLPVPEYNAENVPNGYRYYVNSAIFESYDGQWVIIGYTPFVTGE
ncbi:hypothetical protein VB796_20985 [Arcicella sp. LKC2W]|uniref:hypothetical protein n=1 Tax=Arcicella sp. LKC2W TaxID=2984198 RepID=UPI002B220A0C|nr:hypothetical protein [Arcicella sp. LKC2W]MEA5461555.1 hypothetical protein [Arcicella sp. LKC2W]